MTTIEQLSSDIEEIDRALAVPDYALSLDNGPWPESIHTFDRQSLLALKSALITGRPLLVRGEPGTGKSQLARAVAQLLKRPFLPTVMTASTEPEDLFYHFDAVERLAEAQAITAYLQQDKNMNIQSKLQIKRFITPGPLWWTLNPESAQKHLIEHQRKEAITEIESILKTKIETQAPWVLLLDEIDKADTEVPNAMLDALGNQGFFIRQTAQRIDANVHLPLIVITTNEERALPAAFVRRCLVLQLELGQGSDFENRLRTLAQAHKHAKEYAHLPEDFIDRIIQVLQDDRVEAEKLGEMPPGQAEFLDLLQVLGRITEQDQDVKTEQFEQQWQELRAFTFQKYKLMA